MIERSTKRNTTAVPASDHDTDNHLGKQNADSDTENRGRRDRQCDIGRCWTMIVDRNPSHAGDVLAEIITCRTSGSRTRNAQYGTKLGPPVRDRQLLRGGQTT
ncbi:hypothetical protein ACH5BA_33000 [Kitasatospora sp. NPDC018623]|jgi:nitric oxide reductase activation protein